MGGNDIGFNIDGFIPAISRVERFMSYMSRAASTINSFSTNGLDLNGAEKEIEGISNNLSNLVDSSSEINEIRSSLINIFSLLSVEDFERLFEESGDYIDLDYYYAPFFPNLTCRSHYEDISVPVYTYYDRDGSLYGKYYSNNHLFVDYSGQEISYKRWNIDKKSFSPISIFDDENEFEMNQYGASQMAFKDSFDNLIKDPLIWEEMQKYYPIDSFDSEDEAMEYYERYFNNITKTGCGFAAAANIVFKEFEGREKEFEEIFGYPMYTVDAGNIDFNYEIFELSHFNYNYAGKYALEQMELGQSYNSGLDEIFGNGVTTAARNIDIGDLDGFLKTYGVDCNIMCLPYVSFDAENRANWIREKFNNFTENSHVVIAPVNFDLYSSDMNLCYSGVGGHYMTVTGINLDNGSPIVSSWGKEYVMVDPFKLMVSTYIVDFK